MREILEISVSVKAILIYAILNESAPDNVATFHYFLIVIAFKVN